MSDESDEKKKEKELKAEGALPLSFSNIKLLAVLLKASASEVTTTYQSSSFSLIRGIIESGSWSLSFMISWRRCQNVLFLATEKE